jgi:diguanylate cyclase (GGDEF)-like protein
MSEIQDRSTLPAPPATADAFLAFIVDRVNVGIFVIDRDFRVTLWNHFMTAHSGLAPERVVGRNVFDCFPDVPRKWLEKKIQSVLALGNFGFTSWQQRPYLFRFDHDRPVTADLEHMYQSCTFMPIKDEAGVVQQVCVTLFDVTDTVLVQRKLEQAMVSLQESVNRDGLTGLFNRRYLDQRLLQEFARARRGSHPFTLLLFDLDHFKRVNDEYGHQAGDDVLREVARRIGKSLRAGDILARYGGEEFAIMLPDTTARGAAQPAERIRQVVAETPIATSAGELRVTVSIGYCDLRGDHASYEKLVKDADVALYAAKEGGRNRTVAFQPPETAEPAGSPDPATPAAPAAVPEPARTA